MITIERDNGRFNYRVAGVALHEGHVLVHRSEDEDFWTLPGGRCEMCEPSADALRREMSEELEREVEVERLLWVVENFFQYLGHNSHEIGFYFLMRFTDQPPVGWHEREFIGKEGTMDLIFRWHPLERLHELRIYPAFLPERLGSLPATVEHIVHTDK